MHFLQYLQNIYLFISEKTPITASFHGSEYVGYDLSGGEPIVSTLDEISFSFKTGRERFSDGLLFYSGKSFGVAAAVDS